MAKHLAEFVFKPGVMKLRLEVQEDGFTLWDENDNTWILDASSIAKDGTIEISGQYNSHTNVREMRSKRARFEFALTPKPPERKP